MGSSKSRMKENAALVEMVQPIKSTKKNEFIREKNTASFETAYHERQIKESVKKIRLLLGNFIYYYFQFINCLINYFYLICHQQIGKIGETRMTQLGKILMRLILMIYVIFINYLKKMLN